MSHDGVHFSAEEFDAVFPFHVGFGADGVLTHVGRSMRRLVACARPGARLADVLKPHRPTEPFEFKRLATAAGHIYTVSEPVSGALLRGQMQRVGERVFFFGSPWLNDTAALPKLGLTLNDFAVHDPTLDLLMFLELQTLVAADLQTLTQRLEKSELMLRGLFDALPMWATIRDEQGGLQLVNQFEFERDDAPQLGRQKQADAVRADPDWSRRDADFDREVLTTGQSCEYEIASMIAGRQRWFQCIKFVVPAAASGGGRRIGSLVREVTTQKQLELEAQNVSEQRRQFLAMQREFISMVSHEFRTPLTAIEGTHYLLKQLLMESGLLTETIAQRTEKWLGLQANGLATLKELVDQVLVLNRIEHMTGEMSLTAVSPRAVLLEAVAVFNGAMPMARVILCSELPTEFEARMDRALVKAAAENLISNGLKYSSVEDPVHVRAYVVPDGWELEVTDKGRGIPDEDQRNLFQPFFRASNVGIVPGTGLGLAIVKRTVDFHRGSIRFESGPDTGTRFTIHFPTAATPVPVDLGSGAINPNQINHE